MTFAQSVRRLRRPWVLAALALFAVIMATGTFNDSTAASDSEPSTLVVGGHEYAFVPTTCVITEDTFVAAGPGSMDGINYVIAVSHATVELAMGIDAELETPAPDQLWLSSEDSVSWTRKGQDQVSASATLFDRNAPDSPSRSAVLDLRCSN